MSLTVEELLEDVEGWDEETLGLLDTANELLHHGYLEGMAPEEVISLHDRLGQAILATQPAQTSLNALISEWKSVQRGSREFREGMAQLEAVKADLNRDRATLEQARQMLKASGIIHVRHSRPSASIRALRRVDLLAERWRADEACAQVCMEQINQLLEDFFEEGVVPE